MASAYYIDDDCTHDVLINHPSTGVNSLFMDNAESMRIRFQKNIERLREEDKKLKKKARGWFTPAQKYTKL